MATVDLKIAPPDEDLADTVHKMLKVVNQLATLTAELRTDHATAITELTAIGTTLADYKAIYDAHTHKLPATPAEDENTSAPDTTGATGSKAPGAASAFTDTSGSSVPATITATATDDFTFLMTGDTGTSTITPS
jgi:ABC-type transporter Mla subunit MlaD